MKTMKRIIRRNAYSWRRSQRKRRWKNEDSQIDEIKTNDDLPREWRASRYHPLDNITGDKSKRTCKVSLKCQ